MRPQVEYSLSWRPCSGSTEISLNMFLVIVSEYFYAWATATWLGRITAHPSVRRFDSGSIPGQSVWYLSWTVVLGPHLLLSVPSHHTSLLTFHHLISTLCYLRIWQLLYSITKLSFMPLRLIFHPDRILFQSSVKGFFYVHKYVHIYRTLCHWPLHSCNKYGS